MLNNDRIAPTAFASLDQALARLLNPASANGFIRRCLQSCLVRERQGIESLAISHRAQRARAPQVRRKISCRWLWRPASAGRAELGRIREVKRGRISDSLPSGRSCDASVIPDGVGDSPDAKARA